MASFSVSKALKIKFNTSSKTHLFASHKYASISRFMEGKNMLKNSKENHTFCYGLFWKKYINTIVLATVVVAAVKLINSKILAAWKHISDSCKVQSFVAGDTAGCGKEALLHEIIQSPRQMEALFIYIVWFLRLLWASKTGHEALYGNFLWASPGSDIYILCAQISLAKVIWLYSIGHIYARGTWTCKHCLGN